MSRGKKWVDCPACGAKGSMHAVSGACQTFYTKTGTPVHVTGLSGQFCRQCEDGFWSAVSDKEITAAMAEALARETSRRIFVSEVASVREAAQALHVSVQAVHKMMLEGRLRSVYCGEHRLPIREAIAEVRASHRLPSS